MNDDVDVIIKIFYDIDLGMQKLFEKSKYKTPAAFIRHNREFLFDATVSIFSREKAPHYLLDETL